MMKKRSLLSILLVFVMIAAVCLFVGCDEEETNKKIDNAVVEAVNQATEKIDAAKTALETAIATKADTATINTKIEELNTAIEAAKKAATDAATTADAALKTELEAAITTATKAVADAAADNLATAKTALEALIAAKADAVALSTAITNLNTAIETAKTAATTADSTLKAELLAADEALKTADATLKKELEDSIAALKKEFGDAIAALKKELGDADAAMKDAYVAIESWNDATAIVIGYLYDLELEYATICTYNDILSEAVKAKNFKIYNEAKIRLYRANDKTAATEVWNFVDGTFDCIIDLIDEFDKYDDIYYYQAQLAEMTKAYDAAMAKIVALEYGASEAEIEVISATLAEELDAVLTKAEVLKATLTAKGTTVQSILCGDEDWAKAIADTKTGLDAETDELKAEWKDLAEVVTLHAEFDARYTALLTAKAEAEKLNKDIKDLADAIDPEKMTVVESDYEIRYQAIVAGVAAWDKTYFEGYTDLENDKNYAMLDHAAYEALKVLYQEQIGVLIDLAKAATEAIKAIGTVTIRSGESIEAARAAYLAFTNRLGDLKFQFEGYDSTDVMSTKVTSAEATFIQICAKAIADYNALVVVTDKINTTNVTIYSKDAVDAIVGWYNTYFGVDATKEDSKLGVETLTIDDGAVELTFTEEMFAAVKTLYNAYKTLESKKNDETEALVKQIQAILDADRSTAQREAINAAFDAYKAWLDGTNVPEGFEAKQFAIDLEDATYVITNYDAFVAADEAVKALEAAYKALSDRIAELTKTETDLIDQTAREEYVAIVEKLVADIKAFYEENSKVDCFTEEQKAMITTAKVEIAQGKAIQTVKDEYYAKIAATVAGITDTRVSKDITARADAALEVAINAIKEIISSEDAAFVTDTETLQLILFTAETYVASYDADKVDNLYSAYKLLAERVAEGTLDQEKTVIEHTFAAALNGTLVNA